MGDYQTYALQSELETTAEFEYKQALVHYLFDSSISKREKLIERINSFAAFTKVGNLSKVLHLELQMMEIGNVEYWQRFNKNSETNVFQKYPDLKELFLLAGQKRNIGRYQWVI